MPAIENHMVLNSADALWNAPDAPRFGCDCGQDHGADVKRLGYPAWHAKGNFVEECAAGEPGHTCCHECAVTCRICGCHYCPDHQQGFNRKLKLCEEHGAYYDTFGDSIEPAEVEKLIEIDRRIVRARAGYRNESPLPSEVDWLIENLKEAWESLAAKAKDGSRTVDSPRSDGRPPTGVQGLSD